MILPTTSMEDTVCLNRLWGVRCRYLTGQQRFRQLVMMMTRIPHLLFIDLSLLLDNDGQKPMWCFIGNKSLILCQYAVHIGPLPNATDTNIMMMYLMTLPEKKLSTEWTWRLYYALVSDWGPCRSGLVPVKYSIKGLQSPGEAFCLQAQHLVGVQAILISTPFHVCTSA